MAGLVFLATWLDLAEEAAVGAARLLLLPLDDFLDAAAAVACTCCCLREGGGSDSLFLGAAETPAGPLEGTTEGDTPLGGGGVWRG